MQTEFSIGKVKTLLPPDDMSIKHQRRDAYSILLVDKNNHFYFNKKRTAIPENTIVFVSPNCLFAVDEDTEDNNILTFTNIFYNRSHHDTEFLRSSMLFPDAGFFCFPVPTEFQAYVNYIVTMLYVSSKNSDNALYRDLAHNLIEQIMLQCTIHGTEGKTFGYIDDADHILTTLFKDLIVRHIQQSRAVKYYADKLNITGKRLLKATQQVLGKTPKEVLTDYVITQFRWQLVYTDQSIKEIGREYGFFDENNFSSFFSKEVGMTPTEYRKLYRANQG